MPQRFIWLWLQVLLWLHGREYQVVWLQDRFVSGSPLIDTWGANLSSICRPLCLQCRLLWISMRAPYQHMSKRNVWIILCWSMYMQQHALHQGGQQLRLRWWSVKKERIWRQTNLGFYFFWKALLETSATKRYSCLSFRFQIYKESLSIVQCKSGNFGKNCIQDCPLCVNSNKTCNYQDGSCECVPGFIGTFCEQVCFHVCHFFSLSLLFL